MDHYPVNFFSLYSMFLARSEMSAIEAIWSYYESEMEVISFTWTRARARSASEPMPMVGCAWGCLWLWLCWAMSLNPNARPRPRPGWTSTPLLRMDYKVHAQRGLFFSWKNCSATGTRANVQTHIQAHIQPIFKPTSRQDHLVTLNDNLAWLGSATLLWTQIVELRLNINDRVPSSSQNITFGFINLYSMIWWTKVDCWRMIKGKAVSEGLEPRSFMWLRIWKSSEPIRRDAPHSIRSAPAQLNSWGKIRLWRPMGLSLSLSRKGISVMNWRVKVWFLCLGTVRVHLVLLCLDTILTKNRLTQFIRFKE